MDEVSAPDLITLVLQFLTPRVTDQLAATVGMDPRGARKLRDAGVPATLAALESAVATPEGAREVSHAVASADPDTLAKLTAALGAGSREPLEHAATAFSELLGPTALTALVDSLAQHVDAPSEVARPALGALALAIVGVLRREDPSLWSDAAAVTHYLASQNAAIASALPSDLSGLTVGVSPVETLEAAAAASAKLGPAPSAPAEFPASRQGGANVTPWLIGIVLVLLVVGFGYYVWMSEHPKPAASALPPTTSHALAN